MAKEVRDFEGAIVCTPISAHRLLTTGFFLDQSPFLTLVIQPPFSRASSVSTSGAPSSSSSTPGATPNAPAPNGCGVSASSAAHLEAGAEPRWGGRNRLRLPLPSNKKRRPFMELLVQIWAQDIAFGHR